MYSVKHISKIAYPVALSIMAQNVISVTDTAFLGRVGELELGASALGGLYYVSLLMVCYGFSTGAQIMMSRRNGEQNFKDIGPVMIQGMGFLLTILLPIVLLAPYVIQPVLNKLISSPDIASATNEFLQYRIFGYLFSSINIIVAAFYIATQRTLVLTMNAVVMAIVNIILDYGLIFGHWGLPQLGLKGAAIASVTAEATSTIFYLIYTITHNDLKKYGLNSLRGTNFKVLKSVLSLSIFTMFQYVVSLSAFLFLFSAIERLGERPLAASNMIKSVYHILFIPVAALATTTSTVVGNAIGSGMKEKVMQIIQKIALMNLFITLFMAFLVLLIPRLFLSIYTNDASLIDFSINALRVLGTSMIICGAGNIYFAAVSGTGNTKTALTVELSALVVYALYIYVAVIHFKASLPVCWISEMIYWIVTGGLSYFYLKSGKWQQKTF